MKALLQIGFNVGVLYRAVGEPREGIGRLGHLNWMGLGWAGGEERPRPQPHSRLSTPPSQHSPPAPFLSKKESPTPRGPFIISQSEKAEGLVSDFSVTVKFLFLPLLKHSFSVPDLHWVLVFPCREIIDNTSKENGIDIIMADRTFHLIAESPEDAR